jgi:hypothetical protein
MDSLFLSPCHSDGIPWGDFIYYDESSPTGLRWKVDRWRGWEDSPYIFKKAGDVAGGYQHHKATGRKSWVVSITLHGKKCFRLAHHVVYELVTGVIPEAMQIDHIDGNPLNNRKENLRAVVPEVNMRNKRKYKSNDSGVTGVRSDGVRWQCQWTELGGQRRTKSFNIARLGNNEAFRQACEYRDNIIKELNMQGAGYTEDHGVRQ